MVFDDRTFARENRKKQGCNGRPGGMKQIRTTH
jgi:hypothetical protein